MAAQTPSLNTKAFQSMRDWIAYLEQTKRLVRAKKGVPLKYTLAAIAKQLDGDKAVLFPNPDHHPISVVSGIVSKRDWIAGYGCFKQYAFRTLSRSCPKPNTMEGN